MVRARRGASKIGCLFMALVAAALVYFALNVGQVFWTYYQFLDRMKNEVRFAAHRSDAVIKRRLELYADSLNLPEGARHVHVKRGGGFITVWAEYYDHIELPLFVREIHLQPQASGTF